jgi:DNA-directed RNA polymerase subunit omega
MINPPIEELLDRVDSKFTLVTLASRRGRQVNAYFNQLGEGLGSLVPPQVTSTSRKPLSIAFEEIAADKISYRRTDEAELAAAVLGDGEAEEQAAAGEVPAVLETVADESDGGA